MLRYTKQTEKPKCHKIRTWNSYYKIWELIKFAIFWDLSNHEIKEVMESQRLWFLISAIYTDVLFTHWQTDRQTSVIV